MNNLYMKEQPVQDIYEPFDPGLTGMVVVWPEPDPLDPKFPPIKTRP